MNTVARDWVRTAYSDLLTIEHILEHVFLTQVVAFHAEQSVEKCFKALLAYQNTEIPKIHDVRRLHKLVDNIIVLDEEQLRILLTINELYIDARYPSDMGLLPDGRPTIDDAKEFYAFARYIFQTTCKVLNISVNDLLGR